MRSLLVHISLNNEDLLKNQLNTFYPMLHSLERVEGIWIGFLDRSVFSPSVVSKAPDSLIVLAETHPEAL